MPELWKFVSDISPELYFVEFCVSRSRKISTLHLLAPTNIRARALQTEMELQIQRSQIEKMRSTIPLLQKDLVELQQDLVNHCNKTKEATKEVLDKLSAHCEALRDNLKATAARNAEQDQSIEVLKQELAELKVKAAKKDIGKLEKMKGQLKSELE